MSRKIPNPAVAALTLLLFLMCASPLRAATLAGTPMEAFIFVANRTAPEVVVIDSRKDAVVARIATEGVPTHLLASEARRLITTSAQRESLSVIDLDSGETLAQLALGFSPRSIELGPEEELLAVVGADGSLAIISLETNLERFRLEGLADPGYAVFAADGTRLYLSHRSKAALSIIDLAGGRVAGTISLDDEARDAGGIAHVTRTPGGLSGYALHRVGGRLSIIDLTSETPVASLALPGRHRRAFPTVDSQYILVPNDGDDSLSMISTRTRRESARFEGIGRITGVNTALFGSIAFVFSRAPGRVTVIDLLEQRVIERFALPSAPETAATTPDGLKLYVALPDSNQVAVIDAIRSRLVATIDGVGAQPWAAFAAGGLNYCH